MTASELSTDWPRISRRLPDTWNRLTPQDILFIDGNLPRLVEALQVRYGYSRAEAERAVREFRS